MTNYMTKDLIEVVSELKIESFKEVIKGLLSKKSEDIVVESDCLKIQEFTTSNPSTEFSIENLEHKETGYSVKSIVEKINSIVQMGVIIEETIPSKGKMNRGLYVLRTKSTFTGFADVNEFKRIPVMSSESIKGANKFLDDKLSGTTESQSLSTLIFHLLLENELDSSNLNFITDVSYSDEKKSTYSKIKSKRRVISRMGDDSERKTKNYIIVTEHSKTEIENLVDEMNLNAKTITIKNADEMLAMVNK